MEARRGSNKMGLFGATSYIAGSIIGSGIFVSPKGILLHSGSIGLSLIIWVTCCVISMLNSLVYIELATSIPESGSDFAYIKFVGWDSLAFAFLWLSNLIENSCSCSIMFLTFGEYIIEAIDPLNLDLSPLTKKYLTQLAGFALIWLLTWINFFSLKKYVSKIQIGITAAKLFSLGIIISTGFYFLVFKGKTEHFSSEHFWTGTKKNPAEIGLAIYAGLWAYGGYDTLNYGTEDIKDLRRTLPRAVLGGLAIASFVYILANIAYFTILLPEDIIKSDAVAALFSKRTLGNFFYAMPAIVAFLMIGSLNSDLFACSRFIVAGARVQMMPTFLSLVHYKNESPRVALLFHVLAAIAFSFVGPIEELLNYMVVTGMLRKSVSVAAIIWIRMRGIPVSRGAIRFPIVLHIFVLLLSIALIVVPVMENLLATVIGCGMLLAFLLVYYKLHYSVFDLPIMRRLKGTSISRLSFHLYGLPSLRKIDDSITRICQKIFLCVPDVAPDIDYGQSADEESEEIEMKPTEKRL